MSRLSASEIIYAGQGGELLNSTVERIPVYQTAGINRDFARSASCNFLVSGQLTH